MMLQQEFNVVVDGYAQPGVMMRAQERQFVSLKFVASGGHGSSFVTCPTPPAVRFLNLD
jgi:hypothetical protein